MGLLKDTVWSTTFEEIRFCETDLTKREIKLELALSSTTESITEKMRAPREEAYTVALTSVEAPGGIFPSQHLEIRSVSPCEVK